MLWGAVKDFDLTFIFGFSIKFYPHSCTFYQSAKVFSEQFFLCTCCAGSPFIRSGSPFMRSGQACTKSNRLLDDRLKDDQNRNTAYKAK